MRGTQRIHVDLPLAERIIPAYAGNTQYLQWLLRANQDHPRVCGEHINDPPITEGLNGSSPRMRGTQVAPHGAEHTLGIIPAYAGNTLRDYSNFVVSKFMSFVFHLV